MSANSTLGEVDVCNSCAMKGSRGKTVGGYLADGNNDYAKRKKDGAKGSYREALYILEEKHVQKCTGCISAVKKAINEL